MGQFIADEAGLGAVVLDTLLASRCAPNNLVPLQGMGVYAYFLRKPDTLPGITTDESGILYVGMTEDGLDARNHVNHKHSGFSTLRRSLGAILKEDLNLRALPRSSGASKSNVRCYRFDEKGEAALTEWMRSNLLVAQAEVDGHVAAAEHELIIKLQPPLNLKGWPNPQAPNVKALRSACVREAERACAAPR